MRSKSNLGKNLALFYENVWNKAGKYQKRTYSSEHPSGKFLQTDMEFNQREIDKLNQKYGVEMYQCKTSQEHAFAAEQKIRELKKLLYTYYKRAKDKKKLQTKDKYKVLAEVTKALNNKTSKKYGWSPQEILNAYKDGPETDEAAKINFDRSKKIHNSYQKNWASCRPLLPK